MITSHHDLEPSPFGSAPQRTEAHIFRREGIKGKQTDFAREVRKTADYVAGPGDIHLARPRDVHVEVNIGERTAAVIVRSMRDGGPNNLHGRYDLVTGAYHESVGPRQVPAQMLPGKGGKPKPSPNDFYTLFLAHNIYMFGTATRTNPEVYVVTQI